jgi:hypothetical protein
METLTPAEQYADAVPRLTAMVADLLAREASAGGDIEEGVTTAYESLTMIATAYIERVMAMRGERDAAIEAAAALTRLAMAIGTDAVHLVPPSRVPLDGPAGAVHRAAEKNPAAVVFEIASLVASRAAREM